MLQKLYRLLKINFHDEKVREAMVAFARTGVYDFVDEDLNESELPLQDQTLLCSSKEEETEDDDDVSRKQNDSSIVGIEQDEYEDGREIEESAVRVPEKRFNIKFAPRSENRF